MRRRIRLSAFLLALGLLTVAGAAGFAMSAARVYVVQPGDSLWAISRAHGLTVAQLAAANHLNPSNFLLIGTRLYIPGSSGTAAPQAVRQSSAPHPHAANPWTFCSTFRAQSGPVGVLPDGLSGSPGRLSLQPLFVRWAYHYDLSLPLLEAIGWQESGWQQRAVSSVGAIGVGQIMPETGKFIASTLIGQRMNIRSTSDNIRMSAAFLAYLADVEGNSRCRTIAAYYEGPLNLASYGVFPETQAYVASVEALIPRFE